ncbi:CCA tRNA nucleotidyltransferase [Metabacillus sp. KIGAM252]|uniref:CCA-adding enzyme n=1 Tax=Metabacillus flavus TaxID=2823519 RepID=A0ABS5LFK3_9BACI|nr:CCA tRNA nucleotidyltransferase [Metabacillus flavus]MBS2969383.1 CCA tRNA nucleotidyltransferase [Metabacillus flavus]
MKREFLHALPIIHALEKEGYEAYFVGGSVRDLLLGREIHDVDIATSAPPEKVQAVFSKTADVGAAHGTIIVMYDGEPYEVTTFRTESGYEDFRRPETVRFVTSLKEDLKRRDFTMNAMAMDKDGNLHDYFDGQSAIREKKIKTVGRPEDRYTEDALRMLRALRFSSQLDFEITLDSLEAIKRLASLMKHISVERKLTEFDKLLKGKAASSALYLLQSSGLIDYMPGLAKGMHGWDSFVSRTLPASLGLSERWALLLFDLEADKPKEFLKKWKMPSKRIQQIHSIYLFLLKRLEKQWTDVMLYEAGAKTICLTEAICESQPDWIVKTGVEKAAADYNRLPIHSRADLNTNGNELVQTAGKEPGPWVAEALHAIELEVLEGRLHNSRNDIERWFLRWSNQTGM